MHRRGSTAQDSLPAAHPSPFLGQCLHLRRQARGWLGQEGSSGDGVLALPIPGPPLAALWPCSLPSEPAPPPGLSQVRPDWSASGPRPFLPLPSPTGRRRGAQVPHLVAPQFCAWQGRASPQVSLELWGLCDLLPLVRQGGNSEHGPQTPEGFSHTWASTCVLELLLCSCCSVCSIDTGPWGLFPGVSAPRPPPGALPSAHASHRSFQHLPVTP